MKSPRLLLFKAFTALSVLPAKAGEPVFEPPPSFREIDFVIHGGGPLVHYTAPEFASVEVIQEAQGQRIVWTKANPPSTATRTEVGGLFLLELKDNKWVILDSLRFETSGKYCGADCELASDNETPPYLKISLSIGGRGASHEEVATYTLKDGKFILALPKGTR